MRFIFSTILVFSFFLSSAQYRKSNIFEIGFETGPLVILADIGNIGLGMAAGANFRYRLNEHIAFYSGIHSGLAFGSDEGTSNESRGLRFMTVLIEPSLRFEYFFLEGKKDYNRQGHLVWKTKARPYCFIGGCGLYFDAKLDGDPMQEQVDYNQFIPGIIGGGGLSYRLSNTWYFGIELGGRIIFNDYLDGYSPESSKSNDLYYFGSLNFVYRISSRYKMLH